MIPPILNDAGDCCCQCPPNGQDGWCHCNDDYNGKGDDIENAITCDLVWTEMQANGRKKYFKVVSGSSQQNMPVVLPTASLKKRGVVQLTNELSDREDLALTPKGAKDFKSQLDKETADRIANDNEINKRIDKEIADRGSADNALAGRVTTLEENEGNHVKSVVSDSNATVTVTKQNGTKNSFTINNVAHADSATNAGHATNADNATNARHATSADSATSATTAQTATNADHATSADSATNADTATKANHATSADTATKATNADHALVADRLASGSETGSTATTYNYKKYVLTTASVQKGVDTHTINRENIGNGNYHFTYQYSFDVTFTFPKQIGNASNIVVDAINLVVTDTGAGGLNKLTSRNVIGGLEFGASNTRTFTFYGPQLDTVLDSTSLPEHNPVFVQGNIVVYVSDRTNVKVED